MKQVSFSSAGEPREAHRLSNRKPWPLILAHPEVLHGSLADMHKSHHCSSWLFTIVLVKSFVSVETIVNQVLPGCHQRFEVTCRDVQTVVCVHDAAANTMSACLLNSLAGWMHIITATRSACDRSGSAAKDTGDPLA